MLDLGADPGARGACGRGVLGEAAYAGHVHVIRALLTWQAKAGKGTGPEWGHEGEETGIEELVPHDEERKGRGVRTGEEGRERREGKGQGGSRSVQGEGCTCVKAGGVCEGVGKEERAVRSPLYWAIRGGRAEAVRCLMVHTGATASAEERRAATGHCLQMIEVGGVYEELTHTCYAYSQAAKPSGSQEHPHGPTFTLPHHHTSLRCSMHL